MTINRANPLNWGTGDKLTSAQLNTVDANTSYALDKREGQSDTLASTISLAGKVTTSGAGRIVEAVANGANADTTYTVTGSNRIINVNNTVTANRSYTFSATDVVNGEQITIKAGTNFLYVISIKNQAGVTIFRLGNTADSDGNWVTLVYIAGWVVFRSGGAGGTKVRSQVFTASGDFTVPSGVFVVDLEGHGAGGGGGGGGGGSSDTITSAMGGSGGGGAISYRRRVFVTPGDVIPVTIGQGGPGGLGGGHHVRGSHGQKGADTTFGTLSTFPGGSGGGGGYAQLSVGGVYSMLGGPPNEVNTSYFNYYANDQYRPSTLGQGGTANFSSLSEQGNKSAFAWNGGLQGDHGTHSGGYKAGGGGAGGGGGPGGVGAAGARGGDGSDNNVGAVGQVGSSALDNTGAGGGGGGGGGTGDTQGGSGGAGGAGGSGKLTVYWVK